jgi:hypothetical protein
LDGCSRAMNVDTFPQSSYPLSLPKDRDSILTILHYSMSITSNTQGKKIQREITLAQQIDPGRRMKSSDVDISFRPKDHPDTEMSDRNLPFMVKIPIGRHKVAKTLIGSGASLNLMMRKTFIKMGLNLVELSPVHDTFHGIVSGQSSTPIGCLFQSSRME